MKHNNITRVILFLFFAAALGSCKKYLDRNPLSANSQADFYNDAAQVQQRFLAQWPPGSDAHASYFARIQGGPDYHPHQVLRLED